MRNPLLTVLLVLLAAIPVAVWCYLAYVFVDVSIYAEQGGRKAGQAAVLVLIIVLAVTPALAGGVCMLIGAWLLTRKPWGARFTASVGISLIVASVVLALLFTEATGVPWSVTYGAIGYVVVLVAMLVWLWIGRRAHTGATVQGPA